MGLPPQTLDATQNVLAMMSTVFLGGLGGPLCAQYRTIARQLEAYDHMVRLELLLQTNCWWFSWERPPYNVGRTFSCVGFFEPTKTYAPPQPIPKFPVW